MNEGIGGTQQQNQIITEPKENFWEEKLEVPTILRYASQFDYEDAIKSYERWSQESTERKAQEMEIFKGKKEVAANEGETASTVSMSRVSNKADRAQQLQKDATAKYGNDRGKTGK